MLLSEEGHEHAENILTAAGLLPHGSSLYDAHNISLMHHLHAALRAHSLFHRDQHYVVQNGEVVIVDEFTGRLMPGRRWSDGLHQAVEAKEGVPIQRENQTLASITFQNYFRMYGKLAGMTGTADTEAFEFQQIYHLEIVVIPTHQPMVRKDENDLVFRTFQEKVDAIIADVRDCHGRGPAGARRHDVDRELRAAGAVPGQGEAAAPGPQRQAARARGRDRRAGGPAEDDHHRDQHGGPRHRHRAGRDARAADPRGARRRGALRRAEGRADQDDARRVAAPPQRGDRRRRPAHHRHRAARVAADRQPAARPLRAPGRSGLVALLPVARGSAAAHLRRRAPRRDHAAAEDARGRADRAPDRQPLDRQGAEPGRDAQLRHPQAAARVRRRRQRPAARDLPAAQRAAREQRRRRHHPRHDRRADRRDRQALRAAGIGRGAVGHRRARPPRSPPTSSCRRRSTSG